MRHVINTTEADRPEAERHLHAERESAAVVGFISAIAAYGAFYIPKAYGWSISSSGSADGALWAFFIFYLSCAALTWVAYSGPRGIFGSRSRLGASPQGAGKRDLTSGALS